jgi:WD40 repeat protein/serine/threonine protein kinase
MALPHIELHGVDAGGECLRVALAAGEYCLGSDPAAQIRVERRSVAPQHVRLTVDETGSVKIEDLGQGSATRLEESAVVGPTAWVEGARLLVGEVVLRYNRLGAEDAPTLSQSRWIPQQVAMSTPTQGTAPQVAPIAQEIFRQHLPLSTREAQHYERKVEVARGGMGMVLAARESATQRLVAMKVMLRAHRKREVFRFIEEAQVTAQLEHPNIVPVHDLGVDEGGRPFFTMKLVSGKTLRQVLEELRKGEAQAHERYPLPVLLTIFQKVCDALAFAHSRGVIHRDLKPGNIMIGRFGEVLVMDWGLAKIIGSGSASGFAEPTQETTESNEPVKTVRSEESAEAHTLDGSVLGTPHYMSPEQAAGRIDDLDARSDIFVLGIILYELLTLQRPFEARTAEEVMQRVRTCDFVPPILRVLQPQQQGVSPRVLAHLPGGRVPESLDAVVGKAMAKEPGWRYPSVSALQADLTAYQHGFVTSAEAKTAWKQFKLLVKRNKVIFGTALIALLFLVLISSLYIVRVIAERDRAEEAGTEALRQRNISEDRLYFSHMLLAGRDLVEGRPENARRLLDRHFLEPSGRDLRDWEWYFLYGQVSQETLRVMAHREGVNGLAVTPDGQRVATAGGDGTVAIWDAKTLRELARWPAHAGGAICVAWDGEGTWLATGGNDGGVRVWDVAARLPIAEYVAPGERTIRALSWEPFLGIGARLAIGGDFSEVLLWVPFLGNNARPEVLGRTKSATRGLAWSHDAKLLAAAYADTSTATVVFDVAQKSPVFSRKAPSGSDVYGVAFNPADNTLAVGAKHLFVTIYDIRRATTLFSRGIHHGFVSSVAWSPDGKTLASASYDGTIRLLDRNRDGAEPAVLAGHRGPVQALAWGQIASRDPRTPSLQVVYSGGGDGTLRAWLGERVYGQVLAERTGWVSQVRWKPDGSRLAVAGFGEQVMLFDPNRRSAAVRLQVGPGKTFDIAWSPDGRLMAASFRYENQIRIFDVQSGRHLQTLSQTAARRLVWHPGGHLLACIGPEEARVWDVRIGKALCVIPRRGGRVAWHPDGRRLALGSNEGALEIWDGLRGELLATWRSALPPIPGVIPDPHEPITQVSDVAWDPRGERLAYVTQNTQAAIVDAQSGALLRELSGHTGGIWCVTWSRDGRRLATGGQDGTVRIFNSESGDQVAAFDHGYGENEVSAIDWSMDGSRIATGGFDGFVRVWDAARGHQLAHINQVVARFAGRPEEFADSVEIALAEAAVGWPDRLRKIERESPNAPQAEARAQAEADLAESYYRVAPRDIGSASGHTGLDVALEKLGHEGTKVRRRIVSDGRIDLDFSDTSVSDLSLFSGLPIRQFTAPRQEQIDLTPIVNPALEVVRFNDCAWLPDFAPLTRCSVPIDLLLTDSSIHDLRVVRGIKLRQLCLGGTPVTDLEPLRGLSIQALHLERTRVTNLAPLLEVTGLQELVLPPNAEQVALLRTLTTLKYLSHRAEFSEGRVRQTADQFWIEFDQK